jgi:predicted PurR-regulated permease PerM
VLVYLGVLGVLVGGLVLLAGPFLQQTTALVTDLPNYVGQLQTRAPELESQLNRYGLQVSLADLQSRAGQFIQTSGGGLLTTLVGLLAEIGGLLVDFLLTLVISFYLLLDGPTLRRRALAAVPPQHRPKALFLEEQVTRVLGGYLRGQFVLAATIGILVGVGCALFQLPYAVVLGVLAAVFELVPMFGPILSAIPALLVALLATSFPTFFWVLGYFILIQQIENNVLVPRIQGHAVGLHPLGALFALLAGFQLAGPLGALFAVPIAGVLWVLVAAAYRNTVQATDEPRRAWSFPRLRRASTTRPAGVSPAPTTTEHENEHEHKRHRAA